jgi:LacI family transcriptional regulator
MKRRSVTLKQVAAEAGVSVNTASWVLNPRSGNINVAPPTRVAVLTAARKLGYHRNAAAASLAGSRTRTIGILMSSLTNPFEAAICDAFEERAAGRDYQCLVGCTRLQGLRKVDSITKFLSHGVDGLLLTTIWNDPEVEFALRTVLDRQMPLVFIDYMWNERPAPIICGNHYQGGQLLTQHLLDVGHRRMAFLCHDPQKHLRSATERIRGIKQVLLDSGLAGVRLETLFSQEHTSAAFAAAVRQSLQQKSPPTVILCAGDLTAIELFSGLQDYGISVPKDICLTGYDDLLTPYLNTNLHLGGKPIPWQFPITTIKQPMSKIGRKAADVLMEQIETETLGQAEEYLLEVELKVASSSLPYGQAL